MMSHMPAGGHAAFAFKSPSSEQWCAADARVHELRAVAYDIDDVYNEIRWKRRGSDKYEETERTFEFAFVHKLLRQYQGTSVTVIVEDLDHVYKIPIASHMNSGHWLASAAVDHMEFGSIGNDELSVLAQVALDVLQYFMNNDPNRSSDQ